MPRHRACRVDGVQQCRVDVERPPRSGDGARTKCRTAATPLSRRGAPKKKRISIDLPEEYTRKNRRPATPHAATDMERPGDKNKRRPAAETNVRRGRARRLGDGAPYLYATRLTFYWRLE